MHKRRRKILVVALLVAIPVLAGTALGVRTLVIYLTESPLKRALPSSATDIHQWSLNEPGPLGQDCSYMLKARVSYQQFSSFRQRLRMKRHTPEREYQHGFSPHFNSLATEDLPWWNPTDSMEAVYVLDQGSSWTWAKHEDGHMYVMSWSL